MFAVVSPAKKLDCSALPAPVACTQPVWLQESKELVAMARTLSATDLSALMSISAKLAELNHGRFAQWILPFTTDNAKPAALMFNGDTYAGLEASSFTEDDLNFAQQHLGILSGLYGVLRPLDLIQPYRLEMGTRFSNPRGPNLYAFWGDRIAQTLNEWTQQHTHKTLINLASKEYFTSVRTEALNAEVITPVFKEIRDGKPKIISFFAKRARGMMARYLVCNRIEDPEGLKAFTDGGYGFAPELSSATQWVFTRADSR